MKKNWLSFFNNDKFELIVFLTEKCNFKCVYCYEDFKIGKIKEETIKAIKLLLISRFVTTRVLSISYFGGEPLLNKKGLLELSGWAKAACTKRNISNTGSITTNGYYLDNETFTALIANDVVNYQITLDGDEDKHDELRPTIAGEGTFRRILNNLNSMLQSSHKFQCTLRFNISDSNFSSVISFIEKYGKPFIADQRFTFHFHPIFGMESLKLSIINAVAKLGSLVKQESGQAVNEEDYVCYASKPNSFVIRADGKIQKCTVAINSEINNIGYLLPNGEMNLDTIKLKQWILAENKGCPLTTLKVENFVSPYAEAGKYLQV